MSPDDDTATWAREFFTQLYPEYLRVGPWHPVAMAVAAAYLAGMLWTSSRVMSDDRDVDGELVRPVTRPLAASTTVLLRAVGTIWGSGLLAAMFRLRGVWPLVTFTMQSWSFMTLRYATGLAVELTDRPAEEAPPSQSLYRRGLLRFHEALRLPSLVQNSITVLVWWSVLVPLLSIILYDDKKRFDAFWKFNRRPFLINVHLLNLPLAAADHLMSPRRLVFSDLWYGLAVAGTYLSFYLRFLDRSGYHLYIVLSPRTKLSGVVGAATLGLYVGFWRFWDKAAATVMELKSGTLDASAQEQLAGRSPVVPDNRKDL